MVLKGIGDTLAADPVLAPLYGTAIRYGGVADYRTPLLSYSLIGDRYDEQWNPTIVQFDQYCRSLSDLAASERRLRFLFHVELPSEIGGIMMWAQLEDAVDLTAPDRDNIVARAVRFRLTPLRSLYDPSPLP